ncbi:lipopolysaccharide biosynthesis protein [Exiguobacterium artemiae]|uniref:lipopolysaccharide biosynthesis protein n=1 Tax=Exiguobacterium artemiae TaxID=340145 RepID=UPI0003123C6F|nr:oligosaccharide flippase family protein [Exiguobacterium sibiricum]
MSRTSKSLKNIKYAIVGQCLALLITFFSRTLFVKILGSEYLGLNSLFTNLLTMLSFAELGIGAAITYSLYKPLSSNNVEQIKSLMNFYKRVYNVIGIAILSISLIISPFISIFLENSKEVDNLYLIYFLFVLNSVFSYFFSYKRSLIIADQNRYIATLYRYTLFFLCNLLQIIFLIYTQNYILYLLIQVFMTIVENVLISRKANKMYPFLKENNIEKLDKNVLKDIIKNTKAMFGHKIGGIIVNSTDNLLISKISGLSVVGIYSNYLLIVGSLNTIYGILFQSIISSVGNLGVSSSDSKKKEIFNSVNMACFFIYGISSVILLNFLNQFITIWIGNKFVFSNSILYVILLNFYINGMRKSVLTFRDALGLFWYDRYKPIFEVSINIICSLYLGYKFGIMGVLYGTTISTVLTCLWIEPYILYKYGFKSSIKSYIKSYVYQILILVFCSLLTICLINLFQPTNIYWDAIRNLAISLIVFLVVFVSVYYKNRDFIYLLNILIGKVRRKIQ